MTARSGSNVSIGGDVVGVVDFGIVSSGVDAMNATVAVSGTVTGTTGVRADLGAKVMVAGGVIGSKSGIDAGDGTSVTVTGGVIGETCVFTHGNNTTVTVSDGLTGESCVFAQGNNTNVTVTGDAIGSILAYRGSNVMVTGDVFGSSFGISASCDAKVTVTGDVFGGQHGVLCSGNSIVNVSGSVTGSGTGLVSVHVSDNSTITVGGDIIGDKGVQINYQSLQDSKGVRVTIDGQIKVKEPKSYIMINSSTPLSFSQSDNQPTSSKAGYLEYTDGKSYVWVKESLTGTDIIPKLSSTLKVSAQNGHLHVSGLTVGDLWTVFNPYGMVVRQNRATAEEVVLDLPLKGVYIIFSAGQSVKLGNF